MDKIVLIKAIKFTLKPNNKLYACGNGYISSTIDSEKKLINSNQQIEIDSCIKDIKLNNLNLSLYDTRDQGYDIFVEDTLLYKVKQNICNNLGLLVCGTLFIGLLITWM